MEKDNETDFPSMKCAVIKRQFTRINKCNFQNGIMSILTSDLGWPESQVSKEYPVRMGSTSKKWIFYSKIVNNTQWL